MAKETIGLRTIVCNYKECYDINLAKIGRIPCVTSRPL